MPLYRGSVRSAVTVGWTAVGLFVAALAAGTWWFDREQEKAALQDGERQVAGFAGAAEAALNRTLLNVDLRLSAAGNLLATLRADPDAEPRDELNRALGAIVERDLLIGHMMLVDASGRLIAASHGAQVGRKVPLPPGFIADTLAQPVPQMVLSAPSLNLSASDNVLHAARPVRRVDGTPALAVVEVPLGLVATLIAPAVDVPGLQMTLERDHGELLASAPRNDQAAGRRMAAPPVAAGAVHDLARLDGAPALVAARALLHRQLVVTASWRTDAVLARQQRESAVLRVAAALIALCIVGATAIGHAYLVRMTRARRELASSKALLDQALSSIAEGFLLCDRDDRVVAWNGRYLELFPWLKPVLAVGLPFRALADTAGSMLHTDAQARAAWIETRVALHRGADRAWEQDLGNGVHVHAMERRTPDGGTVSIYRDVTSEERRLEEARRSAESANAAKSRFLATMSHEIRTPLNAVLGMSALLLNTPLSAQQREYIELMRASGQNLLTVINDILDVTQIEAGRMTLESIAFEPARTFEQVVALLGVRARDKGLALRLDIAPPLPAVLQGDPHRLSQVLFNLIGNAIKFTERGGVQVRVSHAPQDAEAPGPRDARDGVRLTIEVRDSGIGIPAGALPRLFERFMQVDGSTRRRYGGSGLGLSITRDIVELMGGRIDVESRVGTGSTFRVTLPLRAATVPAEALPEPAADQPATARKVLVAEDNAVNQLVIRAMLEQLGHRCDIVEDGAEALTRLQAEDYDVVLMDMQMPRLDGLAATRAIRAWPGRAGRLPVLAMTANALAADRQACRAAGMSGFVAKPIDMDQLARMIERVCMDPEAEPSASRFSELG